MREHNKITFVREYCLARKIPYKIQREQLYIKGELPKMYWYICFSIYNLTYLELIQIIDNSVIYDIYGDFQKINPNILKGVNQ